MTDEQRPDIQLGTGSPRSELAADTAKQPAERPGPGETTSDEGDPIIPGGGNAASSDEVTPNRSGSGGSGGPIGEDPDPSEEGSTGQSMDELLGGEPGS